MSIEINCLRELNIFENLCYKLDRASPFNVIVYASFEGDVEIAVIKEAIEIERKRHCYLNYAISDSNGSPSFVYKNHEIELDIISKDDDCELSSIVENELSRTFDLSSPLLHATLKCDAIHSYTLIINISHIISDGISVLNFVKNVLLLIDKISDGKKIDSLELPEVFPDINIFPEINNILSEPEKVEQKTISNEYVDIKLRKSRLINYALTKQETGCIIEICKSRNITVNSFLISALMLALRDYLMEKYNLEAPFIIKSSSGLNLRKYFKTEISPEQLGVFSGFGYNHFEIDEKTELLTLACEYRERLKTKVESLHPFWFAKQASIKAKNMEPLEFAKYHESSCPYTLLTNLGNINFPDSFDNFQVKKVSFMTPMHRNWKNDLGFGLCALTYNKMLELNFIYMEPAWNKEKAVQLTTRVINYFKIDK